MKHTPLYQTHLATGATMVPFAGWEMPVSYGGTVGEAAAVRTGTGIFDVSHMGEVSVTGAGAFGFVQHVTSNDVSNLKLGRAQYSLLLNEEGGIIDDILTYCLGVNDYLLVLNAGCKDKDWDWLQAQARERSGVSLADVSEEWALLAVQGPGAVPLVSSALDTATLMELKRFQFVEQTVPEGTLILSRTGYTGEDGLEIFCPPQMAETLWERLVTAGATPAGLGARDVLRLEAAYPLYGHELDTESSPFESGVGWAVKMSKGDFVGRDAQLDLTAQRSLVGLRMEERAIPRELYSVFSPDGERIGQTTSGTWSPTLKAGIAMARLDKDHAQLDGRVQVDIRGRRVNATVVPLPFYRNGV